MSFIQDCIERGYFYQCTNIEELTKLMETQKIAAYIGMDATATSLHVGNLMQVMLLRLLQKHGHKPIIIIGGATTKIGDPSGKNEMRKMLSDDEINMNVQSIKDSLANFITFGDGPADAIILNNNDWLENISYMQILSNYGRFFSVNKMLSMDSVKSRLSRQEPLSFLEFNYMILQAYDFHHLFKNFNCVLQIGGSDQWGNIIMGVDLIKKSLGKECYGFTTPLIANSDGSKMGKSAGGAVWINKDLLSPYEFFQFWRNIADSDVYRFALIYTDLSTEELKDLEQIAESNINEAKKILSYNITKICHGEEAAKESLSTSAKLFENFTDNEGVPIIYINLEMIGKDILLYEFLVITKLVESKTAAKRLIKGGGVKINNEKISDENLLLDAKLFEKDNLKLSIGKKKHYIIKIEDTNT